MLKQIRFGLVVASVLLSFSTITAYASNMSCLGPSKIHGFGAPASVCDFTFSVIPTFSCLVSPPQTGSYTVKNNSPVTMTITYIKIQNNDGKANSDVTITNAGTCVAGGTIAAGGTCTVVVSLNAAGPFNRILQVGVNSRQGELDSPIITPTTGCATPSPTNSPCALGTTSTFGTLAGSTITNTGPTIINGDLGLSPGTSVTGFPPGTVNGATHITDATAATAQTDLTTLYSCLAAETCTNTIGTADQAGVTLTSSGVGAVNVYCSASSILNSGVLTLSGDATSVFIFQAGSSLTFGSGATVVLTGGATAANVFWQVGSSATLGTTSAFQGTIAALQSVTMNNGATMVGRALARNAAVTFDTNSVTLP